MKCIHIILFEREKGAHPCWINCIWFEFFVVISNGVQDQPRRQIQSKRNRFKYQSTVFIFYLNNPRSICALFCSLISTIWILWTEVVRLNQQCINDTFFCLNTLSSMCIFHTKLLKKKNKQATKLQNHHKKRELTFLKLLIHQQTRHRGHS